MCLTCQLSVRLFWEGLIQFFYYGPFHWPTCHMEMLKWNLAYPFSFFSQIFLHHHPLDSLELVVLKPDMFQTTQQYLLTGCLLGLKFGILGFLRPGNPASLCYHHHDLWEWLRKSIENSGRRVRKKTADREKVNRVIALMKDGGWWRWMHTT